MSESTSVLPGDLGTYATYGGAGILLVIIAILVRLWLTGEKRHSVEITRVNAAHDAELEELRKDIAEFRERLDDLNRRLDEERELRRKAQDDAAAAIRKLGGQHA